MRPDEVRDFLKRHRVEFSEREIQDATQLRCTTGEVINIYKTGRVLVQGGSTHLTRQLASASNDVVVVGRPVQPQSATAATTKVTPEKQIFIFYGHDVT